MKVLFQMATINRHYDPIPERSKFTITGNYGNTSNFIIHDHYIIITTPPPIHPLFVCREHVHTGGLHARINNSTFKKYNVMLFN